MKEVNFAEWLVETLPKKAVLRIINDSLNYNMIWVATAFGKKILTATFDVFADSFEPQPANLRYVLYGQGGSLDEAISHLLEDFPKEWRTHDQIGGYNLRTTEEIRANALSVKSLVVFGSILGCIQIQSLPNDISWIAWGCLRSRLRGLLDEQTDKIGDAIKTIQSFS